MAQVGGEKQWGFLIKKKSRSDSEDRKDVRGGGVEEHPPAHIIIVVETGEWNQFLNLTWILEINGEGQRNPIIVETTKCDTKIC